MSVSEDPQTATPRPVMTVVEDLASMISVNEGATVSRTVMHCENMRLVLFSFDTGEFLSEHTAAMPVILQTLQGALEIEADGRAVVLRPGDVMHFGTRLPHAVRALEPSKLALFMLDPRERAKG
ncbi:cupin domain-containing protein [Schaalia sp. 19OD2882]|uniref:cupin domain-containing protein n=1 Tax=Schaalia sp. 19OD2882 TaxID=2794089 RepID=UPI001C1ED315|nr:cupin domain-containing protein [Schaalia sp. 19OD2882]QWW19194.1 cupin domain-containing protein [Schaalia sp. 19OD2882]